MERIEVKTSAGQPLLDFLNEEAEHKKVPPVMWENLERQYGDQLYSELLYLLTQMKFEPADAKTHWEKITRHRELLEGKNGRDMGLRVALADYFVNINPSVHNPIIVEINLFLKKEESALKDELTGVYNRRYFNRMLQHELERARRFLQPMSLMILDIDKFKNFNDSYGHPTGDKALAEVAGVLKQSSRSIDHLTRYGGEEFAVILPNCDRAESIKAAERHRAAIESHDIYIPEKKNVTVSIGVASYPLDATEGLSLLEMADQALYTAKHEGRNRVVCCSSEKRNARRFPVQLSVIFRHAQNGGGEIPGWTKNISAGGMLGVSQYPLEMGREFELRLGVQKENAELRLKGQCVYLNRDEADHNLYNFGIKFFFNSENESENLESLLVNQLESHARQKRKGLPA